MTFKFKWDDLGHDQDSSGSVERVKVGLPGSRLAIAAALVTVVTLFIYVPVFADFEDIARTNPGFITLLKNAQLKVEKIDNEFYRPGTMQAIELAKVSSLGKVNASRAIVEGQIDQAFNQMESNVDSYLDWYYSLSGEYTRLAKLMTGEIEKYMEEKLVEKLKQEEALKPLLAGLSESHGTSSKVNYLVHRKHKMPVLTT